MNYSANFEGAASPAFIAISLVCLWVLLHIVLSYAVLGNVGDMRKGGREPQLLNGAGWWFFTILSGPIGFAFYWAMHHSSWRDPASDPRPVQSGLIARRELGSTSSLD
jgi:hypothetical protein